MPDRRWIAIDGSPVESIVEYLNTPREKLYSGPRAIDRYTRTPITFNRSAEPGFAGSFQVEDGKPSIYLRGDQSYRRDPKYPLSHLQEARETGSILKHELIHALQELHKEDFKKMRQRRGSALERFLNHEFSPGYGYADEKEANLLARTRSGKLQKKFTPEKKEFWTKPKESWIVPAPANNAYTLEDMRQRLLDAFTNPVLREKIERITAGSGWNPSNVEPEDIK